MKIAVTYENGQVFQHFGHTKEFKVYTVEDGAVVDSGVVSTAGSGHSALAGMLKVLGVDTLICGGIGGGARTALESAGIALYGGVQGGADEAVDALIAGKLDYNPDIECAHHGHEHRNCGEHDHNCGEHGCGEHSHSCGGHHA
jgi:predicted Fe-Mo cluster-binding NifX family protein